jgi:uncharacterized membrane protein YgaE (UPF0421/DUF939 family)
MHFVALYEGEAFFSIQSEVIGTTYVTLWTGVMIFILVCSKLGVGTERARENAG